MKTSTAIRIVRHSAIYDLVITVLFALPWTATLLFTGLTALHHTLGLEGATPSAADAFTLMFANLMGSIVSVWAVYRIVRPTIAAGIADTVARLFFSFGMIYALLGGASPLTAAMLTMELAWALVQGFAVLSARRAARAQA